MRNLLRHSSLRLSILLHPLGSGRLPSVTVALPLLSDGHLLSILRVWCLHHGEDGFNDEFSIQGGNPVLVDSLRADLASVRLHARVVDLGDELDLGWLEGVVVSEVQVDCESATNEGSALRSLNVDVPDHNIILGGLNRHSRDRCTCKVSKFLVRENSKFG